MKGTFLDSKSKQKILVTLTEQPRRFFSVKELAMRTGVGQTRVKSLLTQFLKQHLLRVAEKRGQRYYSIDPGSALFGELKKVFGEPPRAARRDIVEKLVAAAGDIQLAVLTGVFVGLVKGEVDLFLVGKAGQKRLARVLAGLERIVGCEINYTLMTEVEYRERLYSFDWFLKEVMERDSVVLIDRLSKRGRTSRSDRRLVKLFSNLDQ